MHLIPRCIFRPPCPAFLHYQTAPYVTRLHSIYWTTMHACSLKSNKSGLPEGSSFTHNSLRTVSTRALASAPVVGDNYADFSRSPLPIRCSRVQVERVGSQLFWKRASLNIVMLLVLSFKWKVYLSIYPLQSILFVADALYMHALANAYGGTYLFEFVITFTPCCTGKMCF